MRKKNFKENDFMRNVRIFKFSLLFIAVLFSLSAFAQDWGRQNLPDGATARIGKGRLRDIALSPDGTRLAVASTIGVWLYDTATYQEIALLRKQNSDFIGSIAFSPEGRTLAVGGWLDSYAVVHLLDMTTGELVSTLKGHTDGVASIAFSPDGDTIAIAHEGGIVIQIDTNGNQLHTWEGPVFPNINI